jgi:hypothetical protein
MDKTLLARDLHDVANRILSIAESDTVRIEGELRSLIERIQGSLPAPAPAPTPEPAPAPEPETPAA